MRLDTAGNPHLTYCTNVHAGELLTDVRNAITLHATQVKALLNSTRFGVGLRLAAAASLELEPTAALSEFRELLDEHGLYVFTLNGFPYGRFHGARVKESVYEPDWRTEERLEYTNRLARILAALLPPGLQGSISSVPCGFRENMGTDDEPRLATQLFRHVALLRRLYESTGRHITLALEPEPHCYLETTTEAIGFIERALLSAEGLALFARIAQLNSAEAEACLRSHLGVCLDTCHMAVEFEEPGRALRLPERHGIKVAKLQLSAGLKSNFSGAAADDAALLEELTRLAEDTYLHQVVCRRQNELVRYLDLPQACSAYKAELALRESPSEWRVHFHVPIFIDQFQKFSSTQDYLKLVLAEQRQRPISAHLEVETYTWDVLPASLRELPLNSALCRELRWVLAELGANVT